MTPVLFLVRYCMTRTFGSEEQNKIYGDDRHLSLIIYRSKYPETLKCLFRDPVVPPRHGCAGIVLRGPCLL